MSFSRAGIFFLLPLLASACSGSVGSVPPTTPPLGPTTTLTGIVSSAAGAVGDADVTLYLAGTQSPRSGAAAMGHATSNTNGTFTISYLRPVDGVLYAVATGGNTDRHGRNPAIGLMSLAGSNGNYARRLRIDEFTTVADQFALAQFLDITGSVAGATPTNRVGIENAAKLALTNLASTAGIPTRFWPPKSSCSGRLQADNCEGLERLNALANMLAACTRSTAACSTLFALTHSHGTTLAAIHAVVLDPSRNVDALFALSQRGRAYEPVANAAPSAWFLALKYVGNGQEFDGPGAMAIDASGNVWTTNNYTFNRDHRVPTCGGKEVLELTPTGSDAPGAPFSGGGVDGVGWGITLDLNHNVWVGNFGFFGKDCASPPAANSVSKFDAAGHVLSPKSGFTAGPIDAPQGVMTDQRGNIWIANFKGNSLTEYPGANPNAAKTFDRLHLSNPFSIAIDAKGNVWVTSFGNDRVVAINPSGELLPNAPYTRGGIKKPLGNAFDGHGNLWVSNSLGDTVTALRPSGMPLFPQPLTGGGIGLPWGIAVDGNDNVWVADFSGIKPRISELCGVSQIACPTGAKVGSPISPEVGFASRLLQRITGISVDASGNVWVCNNWLPSAIQTNPGGDANVEFIGIAGPVKTPMLGPPQQP